MADYSMPPWLQFDPAQRINQAIQSSRASRDREQQQMFNQNIDSNKEDRDQQEFDQKQQAGARKVAALQKFTTGIKSIPDTDPQAAQKKQSLLMQYAAESGEFTPGIASMFKAAQPAPTFQPLTAPGGDQSSPAPTAPTMPSAAPLQPPSMSLEAPPATPAPAAPTPAPATTPAPGPAQSLAHPAGFLGSKYIPAQFDKPVPPAKATIIPRGSIAAMPSGEKITNSIAPPTRQLDPFKVVAPGSMVSSNGIPVMTNTLPRSVSSKTPSKYKTPAEVKAAVNAGEIKKEDAVKLLQSQFGFGE